VTRDERLEAAGRKLAGWGAAVAWTMGNQGDLAKRCGSRWDEAEPLGEPEFAAGMFRARGQHKNPVVVLRPSGLIGIETDSDDDLRAYSAMGLPETAAVRSSGPGRMHFYYRQPHPVSHYGFRFEGGRVFGDTGRYFVAPPAIHPSGVEYEFANDLEPAGLTFEAYRDLLTQARQAVVEQADILQTTGGKVAPGNRRMTLFSLARKLAYMGTPEDATLDTCLRWNEARCEPPLTREQVEEQVSGAYTRYQGQVSDVLGAPSPDDYQPEVIRLSDALEIARRVAPTDGIAFPSPEYVITRLRPGRVMFLGGYPGDGKSSAALQTCVTNEARSLIFSYEMNAADVARRCAKIMGVDYLDTRADAAFSGIEVYLADERESLLDVVKRNGPYDLIVIDHLHLLGFEDRRVLERWAQNFKSWALELNVPFLVLGQLRNSYDFERPKQSSFRESGMISANADLEVYVWRERDSNGHRTNQAEIMIHKDRHEGNERTELVHWDEDRVRFIPRFTQLHTQPEAPRYEPQERPDLAPFEDGGEWDTAHQGYFR